MAGLVTTFGAGAMTNSIGEIRDADCLFVIGSNTTEAHPIIAMEMKRAVRRGATLIVADPRSIWLSSIADRHLKLAPGTDVWLLNAMAHVIIAEDLVDHAFIDAHVEGFEQVVEAVATYTPEAAEAITGVPADDIRFAARAYATTERAGIYYTLGITEHSHGTDNVYALANLVLMTGHLGKPSSGLNPLRGQNNVQGANDAGASPVFYPGYQRVDDPAVQAKYEASWGVPLSAEPGLNLNVMMKVLGTQLRGLFVMGEDIVLSEPNASRIEEGVNGLDFLVVQDIFANETCRFADVILPAAAFAEKAGTFTNSERRVQLVRPGVEPPPGARPDWAIVQDLANASGAAWDFPSPSAIYDEFVRDTPNFAGISHARLAAEGGLQWPCPTPDHPGTRYLHAGGVLRGKGLMTAVRYRPSEERPDEVYPLFLSTGRTLYHYNAATQTRRETGLAAKQSDPWIEIHPRDAGRRGVADGDVVQVTTRRGQVTVRAVLSRQVRRGCLWMPFHFAEARANLLTNDAGDPVTQTAEFKVCAAEVTKIADGPEHAILPGSYYREGGPGYQPN